jgi:hypothetical protein
MKLPLPINGVFTKSSSQNTPAAYTEHCNNVRSIDVQNNEVCIGQRPGEVIVNSAQLGSTGQPIVAMCCVAVSENVES